MSFTGRYIAVIATAMIAVIGTAAFTDFDFTGNTAESYEVGKTIVETTEEPETAVLSVYTVHHETVGNAEAQTTETEPETEPETQPETVPETMQETETPTEARETQPEIWYFTVNGSTLDIETQTFINNVLYERGIHDWMPVMMCQIYQESRNNHYAEADNGYDKGLLQFRNIYWNEYCSKWGIETPDIFDSATQIIVYANEIRERLNRGETMEQAISDHYTGGIYYDAQYVADVLQWMSCIEKAAPGAN